MDIMSYMSRSAGEDTVNVGINLKKYLAEVSLLFSVFFLVTSAAASRHLETKTEASGAFRREQNGMASQTMQLCHHLSRHYRAEIRAWDEIYDQRRP